MINPVEVQVWWPIVVALLALAFAIGVVVGEMKDTDERVNRVLRRETRRLPIAPPTQSAAPGLVGRSATEEPLVGPKTPSGVLRPSPPILRVDRCGRPVVTNLGVVLCLMRPGHEGEC